MLCFYNVPLTFMYKILSGVVYVQLDSSHLRPAALFEGSDFTGKRRTCGNWIKLAANVVAVKSSPLS